MMHTDDAIIRLSGEDIIELIRENRNDLITRLMEDKALKRFLLEAFSALEVSRVKLEFVKKSLKELMNSPVELAHYGSLILEVRKSGAMMISKSSNRYFEQDVVKAVKNYFM